MFVYLRFVLLRMIAFVYSNINIIVIDKNNKCLFKVFAFDNDPDYASEGLFRIIDNRNRVGFADILRNIIISPQYKFAHSFKNSRAEVAFKGRKK